MCQFARGLLPGILHPKPRLYFALAACRPCPIAGAGRGWTRRQLLAGGLRRGAGRTRPNAFWSRAVPARAAGRPAAAQHVSGVAGGGEGGGFAGRAGAGARPGWARAVMTLFFAALLALLLVALCALFLCR